MPTSLIPPDLENHSIELHKSFYVIGGARHGDIIDVPVSRKTVDLELEVPGQLKNPVALHYVKRIYEDGVECFGIHTCDDADIRDQYDQLVSFLDAKE